MAKDVAHPSPTDTTLVAGATPRPRPDPEPLVVGIDVGTTAIRVAAYRRSDGRPVAEASEPLVVDASPGRREIDFRAAWTALLRALAEVADTAAAPAAIGRIGIACTASTVTVVARDGSPLRAGILWADHRARAEAEALRATRHPVLRRMLGHVSPEWGLAKFAHLAATGALDDPRAFRVVELLDWLGWQLTGRLVANAGVLEWGWCQDEGGGWPEDLLAAVGLSSHRELLPRDRLMTGQVIGPIVDDLARRMPGLVGALVTMGGMDSYLAALGMGVLVPGRLCASYGSSSSFVVRTDAGGAGSMYGPMRAILPGDAPGFWHGGQSTAGLAVDWAARVLRGGRPALERGAAFAPPGSAGLAFRETLIDRRSPEPIANLGGSWDGLTLDHEPAHLFRSVLEAVAFGTRLSTAGVDAREVVVAGGLTSSALFRSILADVLDRPVHQLRRTQAAALGAAFADDPDRPARINPIARTAFPTVDPARRRAYDAAFERYRELHRLDGSGRSPRDERGPAPGGGTS